MKVRYHDFIHLVAFFALTLNVVIGIVNGIAVGVAFAQVIPLFTTIISVYLISLYIRCGIIKTQRLVSVVFFSYFTYGALKTICLLMLLFGIFSWADMLHFFEVTAYEPVGLNISGGVPRMNYVVLDFSFILCYFYWLFFYREYKGFFNIVVHLIAFVVLFSAYSRFLFFIYFLLLFIYLFSRELKTKISFLLITLSLIAFNSDYLFSIYSQRFVGQGDSDGQRIEMIDKLSTVAEKVVLLGNGAGSHVVGYIRSIDSPYSYEVQPIALIYQLGIWWIIYIFCFFVFLFYLATKIIKKRYFYERKIVIDTPFVESLYLVLCFLVLIISTFTNQYIGSTSIIGVFMLWYASYDALRSNRFYKS